MTPLRHRNNLSQAFMKKPKQGLGWKLALAIFLTGLALAAISGNYARERTTDALYRHAAETLALQEKTVAAYLEKYRLLPPLMAKRSDVIEIFTMRDADRARLVGEQIAGFSGARDTAFIGKDGALIANARGVFSDALVRDLGVGPAVFQAVFQAVLQGRLGRAQIVTTNGVRNYVFASLVRDESGPLGIVAILIDFEPLEATWALAALPIFVTDLDGRLVIGNQIARRALGPLSGDIGPAGTTEWPDFLHQERLLSLLGWRLHVLENNAVIARYAAISSLAVLTGSVFLALLVWWLADRQTRKINVARKVRADALRLERRVRDRTRALSLEVEERKAAEKALRAAQENLVQSAKMAAIGQMSTAISHEYNQPLAAIRAYCENAAKFLTKNQLRAVADNLSHIETLVKRMANLSRTLRSFARVPEPNLRAVAIAPVIEDVMLILKPRLSARDVAVDWDIEADLPSVMADDVRLSQILVNLIVNAADAVEAAPGPGRIRISCLHHAGKVAFQVCDNGPGIGADQRDAIFEPFFTTRPTGKGLGIGLSIASNIVRDFGGVISVSNGALPLFPGACFRFELAAAGAPAEIVPGVLADDATLLEESRI